MSVHLADAVQRRIRGVHPITDRYIHLLLAGLTDDLETDGSEEDEGDQEVHEADNLGRPGGEPAAGFHRLEDEEVPDHGDGDHYRRRCTHEHHVYVVERVARYRWWVQRSLFDVSAEERHLHHELNETNHTRQGIQNG